MKILSRIQDFLKICHINIRSLSAVKLLAIKHEIVGKFEIISLSETFLSMESSTNFEIPGFHPLLEETGAHMGEEWLAMLEILQWQKEDMS